MGKSIHPGRRVDKYEDKVDQINERFKEQPQSVVGDRDAALAELVTDSFVETDC